ncbi:DUF2075 domain-containing protein [Chryseobacterium sp. S0630]|uniref:DNA/RNA helicase domain-containing protein n=1 Tax=Chryseobacterium sp. S0630 TaxID=2957803 RepID=UPI00209CE78B|nr:DNA/RNA helicase domain-containing protein [Chryseobacterium sp. S0630]MCP1301485.1 DUF2075 domain-containing protein [Chryseobacterium sp. S0630]
MSVEIINLNGYSPYLDPTLFHQSAEKFYEDENYRTNIIIFNNFPLAITPKTNIDLIIFIKTDSVGSKKSPYNFFGKDFRNIIIPIKIANERFAYEDIHDELLIEMFEGDAEMLNNSFRTFLQNRCDFKVVMVEPVIFVQSDKPHFLKNIILNNNLDFHTIIEYLKNRNYSLYSSYRNWYSSSFDTFSYDIKRVFDQASKDSNYGYLTKKKLNYIVRKRKSSDYILEHVGTKTIIIEGRAGTGKTMELINIASMIMESGNNVLFLSYNTLLVNDVAKILKHRHNALLNERTKNRDITNFEKIGEISVNTIHFYLFHLVKSLGVSLIINFDRMQKLLNTLKERTEIVGQFINNNINPAIGFDAENLKTLIQNDLTLSKDLKEAGILLLNFLIKKNYDPKFPLSKNIQFFIENRKKILISNFQKEVFVSDYHNILKETLKVLKQTDQFYDDFNIANKGEYLKDHFSLDNENQKYFSRQTFNLKISNRIRSRLRGRKIFIDEAHDCTKIERDILMTVFGYNNFTVSSGGKEQLIRTGEVLDWDVCVGKKHPTEKFSKNNRTYRMKSNIVHLVNFIAKRFNIAINLIPDSEEDSGKLTLDLRPISDDGLKSSVDEHYFEGFLTGYSAYENLLFLLDSRSDHILSVENSEEKMFVTENDNISVKRSFRRSWKFTDLLSNNNNFIMWNGTVEGKNRLPIPQNNDARMIYYESCRGLEAYSVFCFALDQYFVHKYNDDDASMYLLNDLYYSDNDRRNAYAITAVIMAMTRAINSLYINIKDSESTLGKVLLEYASAFPDKIKILK